MISVSSDIRSGGIKREICFPTASAAAYPKILLAAGFQLRFGTVALNDGGQGIGLLLALVSDLGAGTHEE